MARIKALTYLELNAMSEQELERRRAACLLEARQTFILCLSLVLPAVTVEAIDMYLRFYGYISQTTTLVVLAAVGFTAFCSVVLHRSSHVSVAGADELRPLSTTESGCSKLLKLVSTSSEVKVLVDGATASGRQLRVFDLRMAREMFDEAQPQLTKIANEQACKTLHGAAVG